jgi:hypothetical protein
MIQDPNITLPRNIRSRKHELTRTATGGRIQIDPDPEQEIIDGHDKQMWVGKLGGATGDMTS